MDIRRSESDMVKIKPRARNEPATEGRLSLEQAAAGSGTRDRDDARTVMGKVNGREEQHIPAVPSRAKGGNTGDVMDGRERGHRLRLDAEVA